MLSKPVVSRVERRSAFCAAPGVSSRSCRAAASTVPLKGIRRRIAKPLQQGLSPQQKALRCVVHSDLTESAQHDTARAGEESQGSSPKPILEQEGLSPSPSEGSAVDNPTPPRDGANGLPEQGEGEVEDSQSGRLSVGDEVTIRVESAHPMGANVKIIDHPLQKAFLPFRLFPFTLLSATPRELKAVLPEMPMQWSSCCKALMLHVKKDASETDLNVVSAMDYNKRVLWKRLRQIKDVCAKEGEVLRGYVIERNLGGLIVCVAGYPCFMPRAQSTDSQKAIFESDRQEFEEVHRYSMIDVCITDVDPRNDRVVVSALAANAMKIVHELRIGSLIEGRVQHLEPYGAFVSIGGSLKRGLLHVRNISQRMVRTADEVFSQGEQIRAVVLDIDPSYSRISLSTADLEEESGEILWNKERVMKNAPIMAARLQKELEEARQQHFSEMNEDQSS